MNGVRPLSLFFLSFFFFFFTLLLLLVRYPFHYSTNVCDKGDFASGPPAAEKYSALASLREAVEDTV